MIYHIATIASYHESYSEVGQGFLIILDNRVQGLYLSLTF